MFLKQSTASQEVMLGPFLDSTDGATAETMSLANTDIKISKAGADFVNKNSGGGTDKTNGFKLITLDATDTATVGELTISCKMSGALPVFKQCWVLEEAIYDAIYAPSATLATSVASILVDTATTFPATIATVDTVVDAVMVVTEAISTNGSGLSAVPWNSSWDAEVQSEVADALVAIGLDHLVSASVAGSDVVDNSIVAKLVSKESTADWDDFVNTTDSLQALRDRGDASWTTGGGGSAPSAAAIADAVWDEATSGHTSSGTFGEQVKTDIDAILVDTGTTLDGKIDTIDGIVDNILVDTAEIGSAGAGLTAVPWNAAWDAEVQSEVADALAAYDPPTKAEMDAMWTTAMTESYASDGATMTPAQSLYMILCAVSEFAISSTTITGKKVDGSTTAMTWTINDATDPTSRTRAS
jgi:hypothetical protein